MSNLDIIDMKNNVIRITNSVNLHNSVKVILKLIKLLIQNKIDFLKEIISSCLKLLY